MAKQIKYHQMDNLFEYLMSNCSGWQSRTHELFIKLLKSSNNNNITLRDKLNEISILSVGTINYISFQALEILTYKYISRILELVKDGIDNIDLFAMSIELHTLISIRNK